MYYIDDKFGTCLIRAPRRPQRRICTIVVWLFMIHHRGKKIDGPSWELLHHRVTNMTKLNRLVFLQQRLIGKLAKLEEQGPLEFFFWDKIETPWYVIVSYIFLGIPNFNYKWKIFNGIQRGSWQIEATNGDPKEAIQQIFKIKCILIWGSTLEHKIKAGKPYTAPVYLFLNSDMGTSQPLDDVTVWYFFRDPKPLLKLNNVQPDKKRVMGDISHIWRPEEAIQQILQDCAPPDSKLDLRT